ncbi:MAG: hypothetical protein A3K10_16770 [Bacteroidetes bacterium RIFCSPLOWO2_12_FULL_31_6]|nr:MAG: hypothetical protein A3K10_16770 [Bacteroidetes bacterium RIFCSPLOWO2_12_FULL_31_6]
MKFPKPWLKIDTTTFLEKIISIYQDFGIQKIIVVINQKFCVEPWKSKIKSLKKQVTIIENTAVEKGRLYSIQLGLQHLADADFVFIQNIDSPFIDKKILKKLQHNRCENGVTVPTFNQKGGHPIIINRAIKEQIINNFNSSSTLHDIINLFGRKNVEVENESILININTLEELEKLNLKSLTSNFKP